MVKDWVLIHILFNFTNRKSEFFFDWLVTLFTLIHFFFLFIAHSFREGPSGPIKFNYEGTLKDLLLIYKPRQAKKLYYQLLSIRINELEHKKPFKCIWVNSKLKEEASVSFCLLFFLIFLPFLFFDNLFCLFYYFYLLIQKELLLYPNKNGTAAELLSEARKQIELSEDGSGKLRLLEVASYKITQILPEEILLECLNSGGSKTYRIEEIPKDELKNEHGEFSIPVAHFHKEIYQTFGTPFLLRLKNVFTETKKAT